MLLCYIIFALATCIAFPRETLHSPTKLLCSLAKALHFPKNFAFDHKTFVFFCKSIAFPQDTLPSLAKFLHSFAKYYIFLRNFSFFCKVLHFPRNVPVAHKTFAFSCSVAFPLETLHSLANLLRSLAKVLRYPEILCICL